MTLSVLPGEYSARKGEAGARVTPLLARQGHINCSHTALQEWAAAVREQLQGRIHTTEAPNAQDWRRRAVSDAVVLRIMPRRVGTWGASCMPAGYASL